MELGFFGHKIFDPQHESVGFISVAYVWVDQLLSAFIDLAGVHL